VHTFFVFKLYRKATVLTSKQNALINVAEMLLHQESVTDHVRLLEGKCVFLDIGGGYRLLSKLKSFLNIIDTVN
jgi:hypothetical protein